MKSIFLVALLLLPGNPKFELKEVVREAVLRNVEVSTLGLTGSGVILKNNIVLSNFHLLEVGSEVSVNGKPAKVLAVDPLKDLILLATETVKVSPIRLSTTPAEQVDEVFYVGNTNKHKNFVSFGRITFISPEHVYTDTVALGGCSGGGLYNHSGELVGLNVGKERDIIAFHINMTTIRDFLEKSQEFLR